MNKIGYLLIYRAIQFSPRLKEGKKGGGELNNFFAWCDFSKLPTGYNLTTSLLELQPLHNL